MVDEPDTPVEILRPHIGPLHFEVQRLHAVRTTHRFRNLECPPAKAAIAMRRKHEQLIDERGATMMLEAEAPGDHAVRVLVGPPDSFCSRPVDAQAPLVIRRQLAVDIVVDQGTRRVAVQPGVRHAQPLLGNARSLSGLAMM